MLLVQMYVHVALILQQRLGGKGQFNMATSVLWEIILMNTAQSTCKS